MVRGIKPRGSNHPIPAVSWRECWAKTLPDGRLGVDVYHHCLTVGVVAVALMDQLPLVVRRMLPQQSGALAGVHDVGKVSPGFVMKAPAFRDYLRQHLPELAAMDAAFETLHARVSEAAVNAWMVGHPLDPTLAAAVVVGAHHGDRHAGTPKADTGPGMGGAAWAEERRLLIAALVEQLGPIPAEIAEDAIALVSGLVTVADWIGSDERYFPPDRPPAVNELERLAADAVRDCGWFIPEIRPGLTFDQVFGTGFSLRPVQAAFVEAVTGPGLYILEAPMGEGKTEAALFAAYRLMAAGHHQGIYFGLPTRLTSDRIHSRVRDFLAAVCSDYDAGVFLAHGDAWLKAFEGRGEEFRPGGEWFHARKRALLYPFAVGTIDQALLSVLNVRHAFVRAFGLAGKVVILDEVHSYDSYTGTLLDELVADLLKHGCTVMVLSATLTQERRCQLARLAAAPSVAEASYPLISAIRGTTTTTAAPPASAANRAVQISFQPPDDDAVADAAVRAATAGACVVCIANTVGRAQHWYNAVCAEMPAGAFDVGLLHSKFPGRRRAELEDEWMEKLGSPRLVKGGRPAGCVLVATQIVEQSVDIDADFMISELAPTDMLLQRAGRLWRHERGTRAVAHPELCIVAGEIAEAVDTDDLLDRLGCDGSAKIYAPYVLWRTYQVWQARTQIDLPSDIRELIEATYAEATDEPQFAIRLHAELLKRRNELRHYAVAAMSHGLPTTGDNEQAAATRWSDYPTVDALLVREYDSLGPDATITLSSGETVEVHEDQPDFQVTAKLHRSRITVPQWMFPKADTPRYLRQHAARGAAMPILVISDDGRLLHEGRPTSLAYDDRRGLQRIHHTAVGMCRASYNDFDDTTMEDFIDESDW